jgi:hypothetical protein
VICVEGPLFASDCSDNPLGSPRIAAPYMGHNVATHLKHYGPASASGGLMRPRSLEAAMESPYVQQSMLTKL